jgi:hypothetical protein
MSLGTLSALAGATKPIDYAARDEREFAQMNVVEDKIQQDKKAEIEAQKVEAEQYAIISEKASQLLEPDRIKIKNKSLEFQKNIRAKIEEYGSRSAFFENGGLALLSKYKTDLLNSEETLSYVDNKKNMEMLMKMQEAGKGHLMSELDAQKLKDYNAGIGDGKITYSGMKSEIEIPEKYFNYGDIVPPEIILRTNYANIYNNWLVDNPKLQDLTGDELQKELLYYTMNHHYGEGINKEKYSMDLAQTMKETEERKMRASGTGSAEEEEYLSFIDVWNDGFTSAISEDPPTATNLLSEENYTVRIASKNPVIGKVAGRLNPVVDIYSNHTAADWTDKQILKAKKWAGLDNKYSIAGGVQVPVNNAKGIIEELYPGSPNASAVSVPLNQSSFYYPNGEKLNKEYVQENDGKPMKYKGLVYGYVDESDKLVTRILDSNGKSLGKKDSQGNYIESTEEKNRRTGVYSGAMSQEMFAVLTDENGETVFQKIDSKSYAGSTALANMIGSNNNIKKAVKYDQGVAQRKAVDQKNLDLNRKVVKANVQVASSNGGVFSTPEFIAESKLSSSADGTNRYNLHKAYYLALSHMKEGVSTPERLLEHGFYKKTSRSNFSNAINYKKELRDALIDKKNYSDEKFIDLMAKVTAAGKDEDLADNTQFAQVWKQYLKILTSK